MPGRFTRLMGGSLSLAQTSADQGPAAMMREVYRRVVVVCAPSLTSVSARAEEEGGDRDSTEPKMVRKRESFARWSWTVWQNCSGSLRASRRCQ